MLFCPQTPDIDFFFTICIVYHLPAELSRIFRFFFAATSFHSGIPVSHRVIHCTFWHYSACAVIPTYLPQFSGINDMTYLRTQLQLLCPCFGNRLNMHSVMHIKLLRAIYTIILCHTYKYNVYILVRKVFLLCHVVC